MLKEIGKLKHETQTETLRRIIREYHMREVLKIISSTYFHTITVSRYEYTTTAWNEKIKNDDPTEVLIDVKCGFSQSNRNSRNAVQTDAENQIKTNPKVFCDPVLDIREGDSITVKYKGRIIGVYEASKPAIYDSHQEIPLYEETEA